MERGSRRKSDGTKFDFKLHFHASRVPISGWNNLVVSLFSIESGRITVRTSKSIVRDGACQWSDPVVESTNLYQNPSTRGFYDKLYKIFVQMGTLRAGILGETTINVADYVASEVPEAVLLPLRNCSAGTILHLKIQCMTPKSEHRDFDGKRIDTPDQEHSGPLSEDNSSTSDISEYPASGNLSFASQNTRNQSFKPASQGHQKDEPASVAVLQLHSEIDDVSCHTNASSAMHTDDEDSDVSSISFHNHFLHAPVPTLNSNLYENPEENKVVQKNTRGGDLTIFNLQSRRTEPLNLQSWQIEPLKGKSSLLVKQHGAWNAAILPQKLEAAEATIKDLRDESLAWEKKARKLVVDVETFKQKLAYESKIGSELKIKVSTAEAECNSLKAEVSQLKSLKIKTSYGTENLDRWEREDSKRKIRVLQEEIQNVKEVNANLQTQLLKTQDSNVNLLTAMTELEEMLDASNESGENFKEANNELEQQLLNARRELQQFQIHAGGFETPSMVEWIQKHSESTLQAKSLGNNQRMKEFESEIVEIASVQQLSVKDDRIAEPAKMQSLPKSNADELEFQTKDLEAEVVVLKEKVGTFELEKKELLEQIEQETCIRINLEAEVVKLGMEIEKLNMELKARNSSLEELNFQLTEAQAERLASDARSYGLLEERQIFISNMDVEKACLSDKLKQAHTENSRQAQRLEELMVEMEQLGEDLNLHASKTKALECERSELLNSKEKLEANIFDLEESNSSLLQQLGNVEVQISVVKDDQAHSMHIIEAFKFQKIDFENLIERLQTQQTMLEEELRETTNKCTEVQNELALVEMKMQQQQRDCEDREYAMRLEISSILSCKRSLEQTARNAEEALSTVKQDTLRSLDLLQSRLEHLSLLVGQKRSVASDLMARIAVLQVKKSDLEKSLRKMEEKVDDFDQLSISLETFEIRLKDAFIDLDASRKSCNDLTEKVEEKENILHDMLLNQEKQEKKFEAKIVLLEKDLLEKVNLLTELESKLLNCESDNILKKNTETMNAEVALELEKRSQFLEAEVKASEEQRMACKEKLLQTETELLKMVKQLEAANEQLEARLMDSEVEQLKIEIIRLQNQNFSLSRKEQELLSQMHTQEVLREEVMRLQEANDLLDARLSKFVETAKNPFLLEKVVALQTELAEALEAKHVYKMHLKSLLDQQQPGDLNQITENLWQDKKKAAQLEEELNNMHERYTFISLKLAEAEAERGELMITVKNLKSVNKK